MLVKFFFISLASSMKLLLAPVLLVLAFGPISSMLEYKFLWCFDWMSRFNFLRNLLASFKALFSCSMTELLSFKSSI